MKRIILPLLTSLATGLSYGQTNQTPCTGGQLLARNAYSLCETDGFWHVVEDDSYLCPETNLIQTFRVSDVPTTQACGQAAPPVVGTVFQPLNGATNCQSPTLSGTVTISECVSGFWQQSTYGVYRCANGTKWIDVPAWTVTRTTAPCANPPPTPNYASALIVFPLGTTNGDLNLGAIGPPGLDLLVEKSIDLADWATLDLISPFSGVTILVDSNSPSFSSRFYRGILTLRPGPIHYQGNSLVLSGYVPPGFGPNAVVTVIGQGSSGTFTDRVTADSSGLYTLALDTTGQADSSFLAMFFTSADGSLTSTFFTVPTVRDSPSNPAATIPKNLVIDDSGQPVEPDICTCACDCPDNSSLMFFAQSFTPNDPGTELATGKLRLRLPILSFQTRKLGFSFQLTAASLVSYASPVGTGFSHSFNMMIAQTGANSGAISTPDLRVYQITSADGVNWALPEGFESTLTLNTNLHRWILTHYSGFQAQFYQGATNQPGYPVALSDSNGNTTTLAYDNSGRLQSLTTDLGQTETLGYDTNGLLLSLTDHLGRSWTFTHDNSNRLNQIMTPATQYAALPAGGEVTDTTLSATLVTRGRTTTIGYTNLQSPFFTNSALVASITDDRGAVPQAWIYDALGRVVTNFINGKPEVHIYRPTSNPTPLPLLDPMNQITRTIDREGNIADYEIHSRAGGPLGGAGQFGIRRKVAWTETGKGNPALRPNEPNYYEQRWLQDCDCLSPEIVTQPFSSLDVANINFDTNGIPLNWPRTIYSYNGNRQVTTNLYTDGASSIKTTSTYQSSSFGLSGQFSRLLTRTDPRAYDANPIYAGLNFVHLYQYDNRGNLSQHTAPTVTRGVIRLQPILESWTYNAYGQKLSYTDPNGDITTYRYYAGPSTGGNIDTPGTFGGYLASTTRGAPGSADPVTSLTTSYKVNALGMVTEMTDPRGLVTDYEYDNLGERTLVFEPLVTLWTSQQVRYTTSTVFDGAGNAVLIGRTNLDYDGAALPVPSVDVSMTYDAVNNLLSQRRVVDTNHANDLITRYAYNSNDLRIATQKPLGNREFTVYDERLLPFRTFYGIARGAQVTSDYPTSKQATSLGASGFIGYRQQNYDSRGNLIQAQDGRGYVNNSFYDFDNRMVAQSDANGNGGTTAYDAAGNALTTQVGAISQVTGAITQVLSRTYRRFDEAGRGYQTVNDGDLSTDESALVDPASPSNPSRLTLLDPGSRIAQTADANGNPTMFGYDAASRQLSVTDALGNSASRTFDPDGNVVALTEVELPGPGAVGAAQSFVTTFAFDGENRQTEVHIHGLNGNSMDDHAFFAFDSRGNRRLMEDANSNFTLTTLDDQNRVTLVQRFDGDPTSGTPNVLSRSEHVYDMNGNVTEDHSFSTATNPAAIQITRYAYDNADRKVRTVYPDSDNPIDGSNNGPSGRYNRLEVAYDAEADPIAVEEPRQVLFANAFDPGRRLTRQNITLTNGVPGITQQQFAYDARNLLTSAANDYASVNRGLDALGRLTNETQAIRLDASGFANGWEQPVSVSYGYDLENNETNLVVLAGTNTDLAIGGTVDALNRCKDLHAQYFNVTNSPVATYNYFGPRRIQTKLLGNNAVETNSFDVKRRLSSLVWNGPTNNLLVGFQYAYDSMDNPLYERWLHDNGDYDHYQYNHRYELTGVAYRSSSSVPPASFPTSFAYNDNLNRRQAIFGGPFSAQPTNVDAYLFNPADQYTNLTRNAVALNPVCDRAGNMTSVPVLPVTGVSGQPDVMAAATWDAMNCLYSVDTGVTPLQTYRYDPFRRRIAALSGLGTTPVRRFIYADWTTVEERLFDAGATPASAPSTLERIYVDGPRIDEHLLTAIDRNGNGILDAANLNNMDIDADQWYYFLPNRLGSVAALLAANNPNQILEYYRYSAFGEATVLPSVGANSLDLSVNFAQSWQRSSPEHGNSWFFTGQRFDESSGLYYYRNRYAELRTGIFTSRDPSGYEASGLNLYNFVRNAPIRDLDPAGLMVTCIEAGATAVWVGGFGAGFLLCSDECGNWAVVVAGSLRVGEELGAGVGVGVYSGCLPAFIAGNSIDIHVTVGVPGVGVVKGTKGAGSGVRGDVGLGEGASIGYGGSKAIPWMSSLTSPCPCPRPPACWYKPWTWF